MYVKYVISATDPNISIAVLAKWIRQVISDEPNSISKALTVARTMVFGESWSPNVFVESMTPEPPKGVIITKVNVLEEADLQEIELRAKVASQQNLLQRAVAGDASAAIEYCRLAEAGKIIRVRNYPRA